jgi:hypothetical protein
MVSIELVKELTYRGPDTEPSFNSPIQHLKSSKWPVPSTFSNYDILFIAPFPFVLHILQVLFCFI